MQPWRAGHPDPRHLTGPYRLALGSCHPRVTPQALWSLQGGKQQRLSWEQPQELPRGKAQLEQRLGLAIRQFLPNTGCFSPAARSWFCSPPRRAPFQLSVQ